MEIDPPIQDVISKYQFPITPERPLSKFEANAILEELENTKVTILRQEYIFKEPSTRNLMHTFLLIIQSVPFTSSSK